MSRLTGLLLALSMLAGCQTVEEQKQETKLDESVRFYVRAIRWGEFDAAASMIRNRAVEDAERAAAPPPLPESAKRDTSNLDGLRVTSYDVSLDDRQRGEPLARMNATFDYYFEDSGRVRTVTTNGLWWYDPDIGRWFFEGELPGFVR